MQKKLHQQFRVQPLFPFRCRQPECLTEAPTPSACYPMKSKAPHPTSVSGWPCTKSRWLCGTVIGRHWPWLVPALISAAFLGWWPELIFADEHGIQAGFRTVWADFAAHLTYAQRFARFPPELWFHHHPLFYGAPFDYPFLTGLISGLLLRLTGSEVAALLTPTMVAAAALPWVIYVFLRVANVQPPWAAAGTLLFYLAGGLGWTVALGDGRAMGPHAEASMVKDTLFQFGRLVHLLLPQRALQLGLPLGLLALIGLARLIQRLSPAGSGAGPQSGARRRWLDLAPPILLGVAAGLLCVVHVHSFLAVATTAAIMIALTIAPIAGSRVRRAVPAAGRLLLQLTPFVAAAGLTSFSLFIAFGGGVRQGFLKFDPYWLADDPVTWAGLWWCNGGVYYLAAAYALGTRRLWRSPPAAAWAVAGWILFGAINLVQFQPWAWDNTKLEIWAFVLLLPGVMLLMQSWWQAGMPSPRTSCWVGRTATLVVLLSLLPTGLLDVGQAYRVSRQYTLIMWPAEERVLAQAFASRMAPGDVVLAADRPHDWVSALAGGQILLGFTGWLWSYGIDYGARQQEVRAMFQGGEPAWELLRRYHVRWAVIDDDARRRYHANEDFFATHFRPVLRQGSTTVYDLRVNGGLESNGQAAK